MFSLLFLDFKCILLCQLRIWQGINRKKSIVWWMSVIVFCADAVQLEPRCSWNNFGKDQVRKILQTTLTINLSSFLAKTFLKMREHSTSPCILFCDPPENHQLNAKSVWRSFILSQEKLKKKIILSTQIGIKLIMYAMILAKGNIYQGISRL